MTRWEFGFPWMARYLDRRYRNIIGHQNLLRFRHQFPRFFDAIEQFVMRPKWHRNLDNQWWWSPGLAESPMRVFAIIDCKVYKTNVPFSGPRDGDVGAPRKRRYGTAQEAFFTGHRSRRSWKVENVLLPNGISTMFGPVSCRRTDIGGGASVQDMSRLGNFLRLIQRGRPALTPPYAVLGDFPYGVNMETIRTYYRAYFTPATRTEYMNICDAVFGDVRQGIEWMYGKTENNFKVCSNPNNFKMGQRNPVSVEQTLLIYLLF